jgi:hypothetical protein
MMEDTHFEAFLLQVNYIKYIQNILLLTKINKITTSVYILQIGQNISLVHKYFMRYTHLHLTQKSSM